MARVERPRNRRARRKPLGEAEVGRAGIKKSKRQSQEDRETKRDMGKGEGESLR